MCTCPKINYFYDKTCHLIETINSSSCSRLRANEESRVYKPLFFRNRDVEV